MSYRPKVKSDSTGTVTDLALDAETVKGVDVVAQLQNKSNVGHTHDDRYVRFDTYSQGLTELQKINARTNIGAGTSSFSGSYNDLTNKPDECIKTVPIYHADVYNTNYIFLWGLKEDTHTLYYVPEGTYYVRARGTNISDMDGVVGTFFGPGLLTISNYGSAELRYSYIDGTAQEIQYGSVKVNSSYGEDSYNCSPIIKGNLESDTGHIVQPLYIKYTSPTYTDGAKYEFTKCSTYAGGTLVTLNGTSKSATTASLYAPTASGTSGQFLKSAGANASPTWVDLATVATSGSYNDLTNKPTIPTKASWNYDDVYVKYTAAQTLTDAQKSQAITNIGAAASGHAHTTTLATSSSAATVTMAPNTTYRLTTGGTSVVFTTPSDAYKIVETLRKGSEATTAVGYYKIATINHYNWNFCDFCMLVKNSYSGTAYSTIFNCSCSDTNDHLHSFKLDIISGTDISNKLAYLYTYDSDNKLIKIEVFIHATRFEHPIFYIINARPGQQLVIPTQLEFNKETPDQADGTTMTGYATYFDDSRYLAKGGDTIGTGGLTMGTGNGNGILFPSSAVGSGACSIGIYDSSNNNQYCTLNGFISGTFTVGHGNFPLNLRGSGTRPQYKGADLALKSDVPTRVTGSLSYPTNTGGLATLFNLINNHKNIRLWTYKYTSSSKYTEIRNLLYFTSHGEVSGDLYNVTLSYINSTGTLTEMTSGTIYYEYFT